MLEVMGTPQLEGEVMCNYPLARTQDTTLTRTITGRDSYKLLLVCALMKMSIEIESNK